MRPPRRIPLLLALFLAWSPLRAQVKVGAAADAAAGGGQVGTSLNGGLAAPIPSLYGPALVAPLAASVTPSPLLASPVPAPGVASPSALKPVVSAAAATPAQAQALSAVQHAAAPAQAVPAAAKSGDAKGDLSKAAGAGKSAIDGDALFDARSQKLQQDDAIGLIISGYRFGDEGRLLEPKSGKALTNKEVRGLQNLYHESRGRRALLRLERATVPDSEGVSKDALLAVNRDSLPREVLNAGKISPEKERSVILRRLMSLYRRWMSKPESVPLGKVEPAGAEAEERLGALISDAAVKSFEADAEGKRLLDQLKDEQGRQRMPTIRVLRLDERYGALYYGGQMIISLDYLKSRLLARLGEAQRSDVAKALSTESGALAYLSANPDRLASLLDAVDVTIFHELVHYMQDLQRPLMSAAGVERTPTMVAIEHEYEAYFRQDLYIHSRMMRPGASMDIERLDDYLRLLSDFETWRAGIESGYQTHFFNGFAGLEEIEGLQKQSRAHLKRLADADASLPTHRPESVLKGSVALAQEKAATTAAFDALRARWPKLAREGLNRWAELNATLDRPHQAALAYDALSRLSIKDGSPQAGAEFKVKADAWADKALIRLAAPEGLTVDQRIEWINALAGFFNGRQALWKKELWVASFRDNALKAESLRADAAKAGDDKTRAALLASAEQFEKSVSQNRATLRGNAEAHLAMARAEKKPEMLRALLEWGSMEAGVLGDAELIAAFAAVPAPR
ncbi:MAG: hypothetical protein HY923_08370 [Elusimicrobia bacterium]|nr:hypothetical protein [Elusimicrobiota bacterium]